MADDGMLMNFDIGDGVIKQQQKYKGGTWKDRLSVKKIAQRRQQRDTLPLSEGRFDSSGPQNANRIPVNNSRVRAKRQRTDDDDFRPASRPAGEGRRGREGGAPAHTGGKPKQIISSLFSFNPEAQTTDVAKSAEAENSEPSHPSNAPLVDGIDTFTSLGLSPTLAAYLLTKLELKNPTAIQRSAVTQLMKEDADAFIQAQTGSGKTLAYLLPIVQRLMNLTADRQKQGALHRDDGLFAIVLAPTRELCKQISVVLEALLRCTRGIVAGTVIGGEKKKSEKARLRKGLNILVATPGRLADHLDNTTALDVSNVRWLVLDEGDRLMDLGFEKEIQGIVKKLDERQKPARAQGLPEKRITVLCSATLKMNVQRLGDISLKDAVHIQADPEADEDAGTEEQAHFLAPAQLRQSYAIVAAKLRLVALTGLLKRTFARRGSVMKAIIFMSCADSVEFHYEVFTRRQEKDGEEGSEKDKEKEKERDSTESPKKDQAAKRNPTEIHNTIAKATAFSNPSNTVMLHKLHGSLPQHVRTSTLNSFAKEKNASVLICTDVAARGLDLPNVDYVIEYDPAYSAEDHLHRIGRTARLGRDGRAMIFLLPGPEEGYVEMLKNSYADKGTNVTRVDINEVLKRGFGGNSEALSKDWEEKVTDWQLDVERWALENNNILEMARRAYQSHIRAYATHLAGERKYFNIKDLHLGHLAKSFALRDRPAKINVPGLRPGKEDTKKDFKADRKNHGKTTSGPSGTKRKADNDDVSSAAKNSETEDAARKMKAKLRQMMGGGASEFNIA
ncbi:ATP-dependent RNA helicase DBP7 [Ascosphaera apis ARSEF 7405]|uniref:ATP-dependent RNA helicase n=1 Tax=Ascosphaera apis ARSEF 7405 TaxID=392613 RepID=A0A167XJ82_9EURO|nr:ATP-dependent RNA helicase DBP7 [Ascosphaera apis ARSEF 7405]